MPKILAVRTHDGYYLEFDVLRVKGADGEEIVIDLDKAIFAGVFFVERRPDEGMPAQNNGHRKPSLQTLDVMGIISEEDVGSPGG